MEKPATTTAAYSVKVTRTEHSAYAANTVRTIETRTFATAAEAREWVAARAAELQGEEINKLACESDDLMEELIYDGFKAETFGNVTIAPFNGGAGRKGYFKFKINKAA